VALATTSQGPWMITVTQVVGKVMTSPAWPSSLSPTAPCRLFQSSAQEEVQDVTLPTSVCQRLPGVSSVLVGNSSWPGPGMGTDSRPNHSHIGRTYVPR